MPVVSSRSATVDALRKVAATTLGVRVTRIRLWNPESARPGVRASGRRVARERERDKSSGEAAGDGGGVGGAGDRDADSCAPHWEYLDEPYETLEEAMITSDQVIVVEIRQGEKERERERERVAAAERAQDPTSLPAPSGGADAAAGDEVSPPTPTPTPPPLNPLSLSDSFDAQDESDNTGWPISSKRLASRTEWLRERGKNVFAALRAGAAAMLGPGGGGGGNGNGSGERDRDRERGRGGLAGGDAGRDGRDVPYSDDEAGEAEKGGRMKRLVSVGRDTSSSAPPCTTSCPPPGLSEKRLARRGICGLHNLGNTCYLNASLQCLSNTVPLSDYVLQGGMRSGVNRQNPIGTKGQLSDAYASLVSRLWAGSSVSLSPKELKYQVGKWNAQFAGYAQHDAQELMVWMLDALHEDQNQVRDKPYVETPDDEGEGEVDEAAVAAETWSRHLARNQSVVVDNMHGMLRSRVTCPECERTSVTFDVYTFLSLPLPVDMHRVIEASVSSYDRNAGLPRKYAVSIDARTGKIGDLRVALAAAASLRPSRLMLADVYNSKVYAWLSDTRHISDIRTSDVTIGFEVPPRSADDEVRLQCVHRRWSSLEQKEGSSSSSVLASAGQVRLVGIPIIVYIRSGRTTGSGVYWEVLCRVQRFVRKGATGHADLCKAFGKGEGERGGVAAPSSDRGDRDSRSSGGRKGQSNGGSGGAASAPSGRSRKGKRRTPRRTTTPGVDGGGRSQSESPATDDDGGANNDDDACVPGTPPATSDAEASGDGPHGARGGEGLAGLGLGRKKRGGGGGGGGGRGGSSSTDVAKDSGKDGGGRPQQLLLQSDSEGEDGQSSSAVSGEDKSGESSRRGGGGRSTSAAARRADDADVVAANEAAAREALRTYPFVLRLTDATTQACSVCSVSSCAGCVIRADGSLTNLTKSGQTVIIEWARDALRNSYNDDRMDSVTVDESVTAARRAAREAGPDPPIELLDTIVDFCQEERLGPRDEYYCRKCKTHVRALKQMSLWSAPPILLVHLKRFAYTALRRAKISRLVNFPTNLDLTSLVLDPTTAPLAHYELYAVLNHVGSSSSSGHYTAIVRSANDGAWYRCDDATVTPVDEDEIVTPQAYVLCYRRKGDVGKVVEECTEDEGEAEEIK
mmetsp:Transcript_15523/g.48578  ORF Transcript_15523/g.48578 Transcript_15523/m.48578 type:complete len:1140 (-) Transcript_15523:33-3452(-)